MEYIRLLPKKALSRTVGHLVQVKNPAWLALKARDWFIERYNINVAEAEHSLDKYPTIAELFIRRLKQGVRPIGEGVIHPCDGRLTVSGHLSEGALVQSKGISYSLNELLKNPNAAHVFEGGSYFTYYLCPTDYHRVHSPVDGEVMNVLHVPGRLWPVNPWSVENISQLFAINERVVFNIKTAQGPVALVMVGATNVGDISVAFDESVRTNRPEVEALDEKVYIPHIPIKKGDELGTFHMGSSVVVVYPKGMQAPIAVPWPVKLGESVK
jgi:phosphatidylserine decarboxylase